MYVSGLAYSRIRKILFQVRRRTRHVTSRRAVAAPADFIMLNYSRRPRFKGWGMVSGFSTRTTRSELLCSYLPRLYLWLGAWIINTVVAVLANGSYSVARVQLLQLLQLLITKIIKTKKIEKSSRD